MSTFSFRSTMRAARSKSGVSNTIGNAPIRASANLTPEEFPVQATEPGSSALVRTARPAQELLPRAPALDPKPNSFSVTLRPSEG
jgi:hypothetical protein